MNELARLSPGAVGGAEAAWTLMPSFGGCSVAVRTDAAEAAVALARELRFLTGAPAGELAGEIRVRRSGDAYDLPSPDEASVRNGSLGEVVRCARHHVIRLLVQASPALLWLHAAAAASDRGVVAIAGGPGAGKSAIVTALVAGGWRYLTDEATAIDPQRNIVHPFPTVPAFRLGPGRLLDQCDVERLPKREVDLLPGQICEAPSPLAAIVLPEYSPGAVVRFQRLGPSHAVVALLGSYIGTPDGYTEALHLLGTVVGSTPVTRLTYGDRHGAARALKHAFHTWGPDHQGMAPCGGQSVADTTSQVAIDALAF